MNAPATTRDPIGDALGSLEQLALVHDRPELAEAAEAAGRRLTSSAFRVVVMGEFKQGKSSLINALLDVPACAVDDDIATAARLEIGFADPAAARRWHLEVDGTTVVDELPPDDAAAASTDPATTLLRLGVPRRLLRSGLVLVDTPGVGGVASATSVVTASSLAEAHAVLFVTDASQELTKSEVGALLDAAERCPHVLMVVTKIDMYPAWREIVAADREHLARHELGVPVVAVSSHVRQLALRAESRRLNEESGFPALVRAIEDDLLGTARSAVRDDALTAARRIYAHLREPVIREIDLLERSEDDGELRRVAEDARADVELFRERAATWQQLLSDGCTDLAAAVDVDLRDRVRELVREAEQKLDDADPDETWHEFEPDLYRRTAEALDANLTLLRERADELARRLAAAISDDEDSVIDLGGVLAEDVIDSTARRKSDDGTSSGARAQQAFRAGYGGAMPIMAVGGMALGVLGLGTMVLPLAAVAGVMAGRRALTDERERRLNQRRQQAKIAVKKFTDDALFRASAERKQGQRTVQRRLRDHFGRRVKELAATRQHALQRAEAAVKATDADRRQRLAAARDELARIEQVAHRMAADS